MTYHEVIRWLEHVPNYAYLGLPREQKLARVKTALSYFGDPHQLPNIIHVAGSKGKSSTSISCSYCLQKVNFRVGLFTSPHVQSYRERIICNNEWITKTEFVKYAQRIKNYCDSQQVVLIPFEILFLISCMFFRDMHCDWVIFEVGLGGRYDTTNIVTPSFCIITEIEKEHTDILGDQIKDITYEKAGIIKPHAALMIGAQAHAEAKDQIITIADKMNSPYYYAPDLCKYTSLEHTIDFTRAEVTIATHKTTKNMLIKSRAINPAIFEDQLMGLVVSCLATQEFQHYCDTIETFDFTESALLPARSEVLKSSNYLFLDGSHTLNSCEAALTCIRQHFQNSLLIFSLAYNKEHSLIIDFLKKHLSLFSEMILTSTGQGKKSDPTYLYNKLSSYHPKVQLIPDIPEAFEYAIQTSESQQRDIACLGSFFLASEIRHLWKHRYGTID